MVPTPTALRDLLATLLAGAVGKTPDYWRSAIGEVEMLPIYSHAAGNWRVHPKAGKQDLEVIQKAVDLVRQEHPYVVH